MPFDPTLFLAVARSLDTASATEADLRTCNGRAYYAAYLVARDRLDAMGFRHSKSDDGGVHAWLIGRLKNSHDQEVRTLGRHLRGLFDGRLQADYDVMMQAYSRGSGHNAAVRSEQWLRQFRQITDAQLRAALK